MTIKVVLLNGPPRAGKDTLAAKLVTKFHTANVNGRHAAVAKFAAPLKTAAAAIYCFNNQAEFAHFDSAEEKDKPSDVFLGKTCREVQIGISEVYAKPFHGETVFGQMLVNRLKAEAREVLGFGEEAIFFVSDSGFRPEAEEIVKAFGAENVLLVRILREGFTYEGDSRGYINLDDLDVETLEVTNVEGAANYAAEEVEKFIKKFL